jgi:hypothetical protein
MEIVSVLVGVTITRKSNQDAVDPQFIRDAVEEGIEQAFGEQGEATLVEAGEAVVVDLLDLITRRNGAELSNVHPLVTDGVQQLAQRTRPAPDVRVMSVEEFLQTLRAQAGARGQERVQPERLLGPAQSEPSNDIIGPHGIGCTCPWDDETLN